MKEYQKIEAPFYRDARTKRVHYGIFNNPTVKYLKDIEWVWTEKIDGTNIRIHWDGHKVEIGGRTDNAQIPTHLYEKLSNYFCGEANEELFEQTFGEKEVILFGEGYGAKIQNGGNYITSGVDFILFDVMINGVYLEQNSIIDIAVNFGIDIVPIILIGTIDDAVEYVKHHPKSTIGAAYMEGLVGRPKFELYDRRGKRIIVKVKWNDVKDFD